MTNEICEDCGTVLDDAYFDELANQFCDEQTDKLDYFSSQERWGELMFALMGNLGWECATVEGDPQSLRDDLIAHFDYMLAEAQKSLSMDLN